MVDKAHILSEIRRTALKNGGAPLGVDRFATETGIRQNDWLGKHWARWGDALTEAGFQPNELTGAYSDEYLHERLIDLCRKLGHFPTRVEIQLARRQDPTFPTPKVFQRRGTKRSVAEHLARFCQGRDDLADIVQMCDRVTTKTATSEESLGDSEIFGFVYLLKSGRFYKVGRTNSVGRRERELAIQLPEKATLIHSIRTDDPVGIEEYWHRRFGECRANGEWFELRSEHIQAFKRRKFM